jgi:hypothetical protein
MAAVLKQTLPGQAAPPVEAASWVNPNQAALDAATAALAAPQAPMFTPEQQQQRQDANRRQTRWGMLGLMMGDEGQQRAGGKVLQQALDAKQERVTDQGVFNPVTGQMDMNPEYVRQRAQTRQERLQDMVSRSQESHDTREDTQAFQKSQLGEQIASRNQNAQLQREMMADNRKQAGDQKNLTLSRQFNEDWQKVNKDDLGIRNAYQNLSSLPSTPAGDISFVYNWMKSQDPNSTVRESEFATAARAGSLGTKIQNYVNQVASGNLLTAEQRAGMMGSTKAIVDQAEARMAQRNAHYDRQARLIGVDPESIVPEYGRTAAELQARDAAAAGGPPGAAPPIAPKDRRGGADRRGAAPALPAGLTPDMIAAELARRGGK